MVRDDATLRTGLEGHASLFLPQSAVAVFVKDYWRAACARLGLPDHRLLPYLRIRDQLRRREHVPLLTSLPWESAWALINLRNDYSRDLLAEFHRALRQRRHPTSELQPLQYYIDTLAPPWGADGPVSTAREGLHVVLALSYAESPSQPGPQLAGGVMFEYFDSVNCALITHAHVLPSKRNRQALLARLLEEVARTVDVAATSLGHLAGASAVFMAVHPVSAPLPADVLPAEAAAAYDIAAHHGTLADLGLRLLDLDFVLPPLARTAARLPPPLDPSSASAAGPVPMLLTVVVTPRIPQYGLDGPRYLPNHFITRFVLGARGRHGRA